MIYKSNLYILLPSTFYLLIFYTRNCNRFQGSFFTEAFFLRILLVYGVK